MHDHPALAAAAAGARDLVPLFCLDDLPGPHSPARQVFLLESLRDLDGSLRARGGALVVRRGETVRETVELARRVGASAVHLSEDVSAFAQQRARRLADALARERIALHLHPGVTIVPPGDLAPADRDHFLVFTPFWRRWSSAPRRLVLPPPGRISLPEGLSPPAGVSTSPGHSLLPGGEGPARVRLETWLGNGLSRYAELRDDLAADATSHLGAYLHLGCLSPLELESRTSSQGEAFARQLCWRDFYHQLLAARPSLSHEDLRPARHEWAEPGELLDAWLEGSTGYPLVDAAMRQLGAEGTMPNRARLVVASFLTKTLRLDWRLGARAFAERLLDGDVASNSGNWQWVAGTGTDTRPHRVLSPTRQAHRFDPDGAYVRRHVPELASIDGPHVHEPWRLGLLRPDGYPKRLVVHEEALARP